MIPSLKIRPEHQARQALIYIRQSTPEQLTHNPESTARQYALQQRAQDLGWPTDAITVIDDDLGKSGASAAERTGFQRLVAEVSLGRVGLVLSLETSRLARSGRDWYHLVELCALAQTLLADEDGIYDPATYNDRLLLGLKGTMSEAELHLLRQRLAGGARQKASRGELKFPLPTGYVWGESAEGRAEIQCDPDAGVQAAIQHVFALFAQLGSAAQVLRALVREGAQLPRRLRVGPGKGQLVWVPPADWMVLQIVRDPIYAGAYAYGRQRRRRPGDPTSGIVLLPPSEWAVLLRGHHAGYIDWLTYERNRAQLQANHADYRRGQPGAPQRGPALLQGLAYCGYCGHRMYLRYSGPAGRWPVYHCHYFAKTFAGSMCQEIRAPTADAAVAHALLAALQPAPLEAALHAVATAEHEAAAQREAWQLRLERARYAAERARRQYDAVEPEYRLVARELERRWNAALREVAQLEAAEQEEARRGHGTLTDTERAEIRRLAAQVPAVWADARTSAEDRKRLLRCLVETVVLRADKPTDQITLDVQWKSGAQSQLVISRPVHAYAALGRYPEVVARIRTLAEAGRTDQEIAAQLTADGVRPARGTRFGSGTIWQLRQAEGIAAGSLRPPAHAARTRRFTVHELARELDVFPGTVYHWLLQGHLSSRQRLPRTQHWIDLTAAELRQLHAYVRQQHARIGRPHNRSKKGAA